MTFETTLKKKHKNDKHTSNTNTKMANTETTNKNTANKCIAFHEEFEFDNHFEK